MKRIIAGIVALTAILWGAQAFAGDIQQDVNDLQQDRQDTWQDRHCPPNRGKRGLRNGGRKCGSAAPKELPSGLEQRAKAGRPAHAQRQVV